MFIRQTYDTEQNSILVHIYNKDRSKEIYGFEKVEEFSTNITASPDFLNKLIYKFTQILNHG